MTLPLVAVGREVFCSCASGSGWRPWAGHPIPVEVPVEVHGRRRPAPPPTAAARRRPGRAAGRSIAAELLTPGLRRRRQRVLVGRRQVGRQLERLQRGLGAAHPLQELAVPAVGLGQLARPAVLAAGSRRSRPCTPTRRARRRPARRRRGPAPGRRRPAARALRRLPSSSTALAGPRRRQLACRRCWRARRASSTTTKPRSSGLGPGAQQRAGRRQVGGRALGLARVQQVLGVQQVRIRQRVVVVHQLVDRERAVGVGDGLRRPGRCSRRAVTASSRPGPGCCRSTSSAPSLQGVGQHRAGAAVVAGVGVGLAEQQRVAHELGQVAAGLAAQPLDAVVHAARSRGRSRRCRCGGGPARCRGRDAAPDAAASPMSSACCHSSSAGLVAAAAGGDQAEALVGLAHALGVGVDLRLAQHAAQQLLGLARTARAGSSSSRRAPRASGSAARWSRPRRAAPRA